MEVVKMRLFGRKRRHISTGRLVPADPSEDSSTCRLSREALGNHLVLRNLFKHCDTKLLKSMRLVCFLWYEESLEEWRKTAILLVSVHGRESRGRRGKEEPPSSFISLKELFASMKDPEDRCKFRRTPLQQFKLVDTTKLGFPELDERLGAFWTTFGSMLRGLTLPNKVTVFLNEENLLRIAPKLDHLSIPIADNYAHLFRAWKGDNCICNLKSLVIREISIRVDWLHCLSNLPHLKALTVDHAGKSSKVHYGSVYYLGLRSLLQALGLRNKTGPTLSLEHLEMEIPTYKSVVSLCIALARHQHTLKVLKLFRRQSDPEYFGDFPFGRHFDRLTELHLRGHRVDNLRRFLGFMRNLKILSVNRTCVDLSSAETGRTFDKTWKVGIANEKIGCLESIGMLGCKTWKGGNDGCFVHHALTSFEMDFYASRKSLAILKRLMPNLTTLNLIFTDETMMLIAANFWSGLRNKKFQRYRDRSGIWSLSALLPRKTKSCRF